MAIPKTMKAAVVNGIKQPLSIKEVPVPEIKKGEVLLKVEACGVCHSDQHVLEGDFGELQVKYLGHEFIGKVVAVSEGETKWKIGDRIGGPWHGGHDFTCRACARAQFQFCDNKTVNGVFRNGGYAEYATLRSESGVRIPESVDAAEAAPLLCAGVTVFNSIRRMNITAGEVVAVQGLGGLGHLAIQYCRKMGFRTVALSRGTSKKKFAMELGATDYIDIEATDVAEELQKLGGAALIAVTATNSSIIPPLLNGLQPTGKLLTLSVVGDIPVSTSSLIQNGLSVHGWAAGHSLDCEEAIAFAETHGVKCMVEKFPLEKVNEALEHMKSGKVRFRSVLVME